MLLTIKLCKQLMNVSRVPAREEQTGLVCLHVSLKLRDSAISTYPELYGQGTVNVKITVRR